MEKDFEKGKIYEVVYYDMALQKAFVRKNMIYMHETSLFFIFFNSETKQEEGLPKDKIIRYAIEG